MADKGVRAGGYHALAVSDLDGSGGKGVDAEDSEDDIETENDEQITDNNKPLGNTRPEEAVIEGWHDYDGEERERSEALNNLLAAGFLGGRACVDTSFQKSWIAFPEIESNGARG